MIQHPTRYRNAQKKKKMNPPRKFPSITEVNDFVIF
uniref:Uncharacterized protein n=1 Tax=Nelumbo nucifera TaxID=4432 RepID=A0A822ZAM8_NELNU|nr:TPA_asm: hypothetical protein HUJ06_014419 [Nelumbo nucifera]